MTYNMFQFHSKQIDVLPAEIIIFNEDIAITHLSEAITYKTISHEEAESLGHAFFAKFPSDSGKGSVFKSTNLLDSGFSRRIKDVHMKARAVNIGQNSGGRFKMVLRLIDKTKSHKAERFEDKGFSRQVAQALRAMEMASNGMVLIIGETGSGKSTSLHNAVMNEMQRTTGTRAIYSLEQPIEQEIPDITQIETSRIVYIYYIIDTLTV